jgi:cell wall-associated NlpC family hydrolase
MLKKTAFILWLISFSVMFATGAEISRTAVVIKTVENMHSASNDAVDVVSQALLGTNVKILAAEKNAKGEEWFRIETPDTYQGWIVGTSLRPIGEGRKAYASEGNVFEVTSLLANIYSIDDVTERKPLTVAPIGAVLEVGNCGERWSEVTLPCGTKAWIQKGDGEIVDAAAPRKRLSPDETVALAKRFLGLPYLWSGVTPYGLDCSGYAQLLYRLSGIDILRDTAIQMTKSGLVEVPAGQERTRDLIFFGKAKDKIVHVGMMISAEEFIHATTYEKPVVQISRFKDPHWQAIYQGARRPKE